MTVNPQCKATKVFEKSPMVVLDVVFFQFDFTPHDLVLGLGCDVLAGAHGDGTSNRTGDRREKNVRRRQTTTCNPSHK